MTECASSREAFTAQARVDGKECEVRLERGWFGWKRLARGRTTGARDEHVQLLDVIAVLPSRRGVCLDKTNRACSPDHVELTVYEARRKQPYNRIVHPIVVEFNDPAVCQEWCARLQDFLADIQCRPKQVHVFINPVGGRKRAPQIYETFVAPLFELAGVTAAVTVTERANHALDKLQTMDLTGIDGFICVGGDGMFHEVLNGLLLRTQQDAGVIMERARFLPVRPRTCIGIVPAGSTDAVVFGTTGTVDATTSALQIILGQTQSLDVASIESEGTLLRFASLACSYGFLGDTLEHSETLRWMGPKRYDIAGARCFLKNRGYECKIRYLPSDDGVSHPLDKSLCVANCVVCSRGVDELETNGDNEKGASAIATTREVAEAGEDGDWQCFEGRFSSVMACLSACATPRSKAGLSPSAHFGDGCLDLLVVRHGSRTNTLRQFMRVANQGSPLTLPFVDARRCKEIQFRPIVPPHLEGARRGGDPSSLLPLSRSSSQQPLQNGARPTGSVYPDSSSTCMLSESRDTNAAESPTNGTDDRANLQLQLRDHVSIWNVDGEIVTQAGIDIRVHRQLITLYCSGIPPPDEVTPTGCFGGSGLRVSPT